MLRKLTGKLLGFVLATALVVLTAAGHGGAVIVPDNLLRNSNFEHCTGCTSEGGTAPDQWTANGASGGDVSWTTAEAAFANASVHISDTSSTTAVGVTSASVDASSGVTYIFEIWTKAGPTATPTTPVTLGITYLDAGGQVITTALRTITLRSSWTPWSLRRAAPLGTESVNVTVFSPVASTGDFYADAASLLIDVPVVRP